MDRLQPWQRAVASLAVVKVLLGLSLFAYAFGTQAEHFTRRDLLMSALVLVYGAAAAMLMTLGRRDLRATVLGVTFLLTAAVFADGAIALRARVSPQGFAPLHAFFGLQVDAFTAYFLWLFVHEFPRIASFGARNRLPVLGMRVSLALGTLLFVLNAVYSISVNYEQAASLTGILWPVARANDHGFYWPLQYVLALSAFAVLIWKSRVAPITEARRVALLIGGLALGTGPTIIWVTLSILSPTFRRLMPLRVAGWLIYPMLASTPFTTAYAVLVHRALNARLIIRGAIRYAFARYTVLTVAAFPVLILAVALYRHRDESVTAILSGTNAALMALLALLALAMARGSRPVLDQIDRRFFRDQYDARVILGKLVERCRRAVSRADLAAGLKVEIDRALHPTSVSVLFLQSERGSFEATPGTVRPLSASSEIIRELRLNDAPLQLDLESQGSIAAHLPSSDRYWIADSGAQILLALRNTNREPIGIVALGEKRSELPYSEEDRQLLSTVAAAAALSLDSLGRDPATTARRGFTDQASASEPASMCIACGKVDEHDTTTCNRCGSPMMRAPLPRFLAGKFMVVERIGEGGMGVVYRGIDISLDREVAIKTLPQVSPRAATRLRREARAMAAVTHPNLALIYGGESWNGMPILVVEFLPNGMLSKRLAEGPLELREVIQLGLALADVTTALHAAGILHRDIKPSNIGYTANWTPKLLDFGLAGLLSNGDLSDRTAPVRGPKSGGIEGVPSGDIPATLDGQVVGTPRYMSPEAMRGQRPEPSFDLWSIAMVLFEAWSGMNPARPRSSQSDSIGTRAIADLRPLVPAADERVVRFFESTLAPNAADRPRSAAALREQLQSLLDVGVT